MVAAHNWEQVPIGKARIYEFDNEAIADFALNLQTREGRNWYNALKFDLDNPPALQNYSYGFSIPTGGSDSGMFDGQQVRFLKRVEVHEVSPVLLGAGIGTRTVELRGRDSRLDQSRVVASALDTLHRVEACKAVNGFNDIRAKVKALNAKHWREVNHCDWRLDAALFLSSMVAKELGIDPPLSVKFFREASDDEPASFTTERDLLGRCRQSERIIWINEKLAGHDLIETTAHEVRHLAQSASSTEGERDCHERDADVFGKRFAGRFKAVPASAEIYVHPWFAEWDPYATHYDAPKGSWLFNLEDSGLYERIDFRWWKKENWR